MTSAVDPHSLLRIRIQLLFSIRIRLLFYADSYPAKLCKKYPYEEFAGSGSRREIECGSGFTALRKLCWTSDWSKPYLQDTLFLRPGSPSGGANRGLKTPDGSEPDLGGGWAVPGMPGPPLLSDRPHTISSAYEKGHQRPALQPYTFNPPERTIMEVRGSATIGRIETEAKGRSRDGRYRATVGTGTTLTWWLNKKWNDSVINWGLEWYR